MPQRLNPVLGAPDAACITAFTETVPPADRGCTDAISGTVPSAAVPAHQVNSDRRRSIRWRRVQLPLKGNPPLVSDDWPPRQPATARALITDHSGRVLVVKDTRPQWYLPGGRIEQDEAPRAACEREVLEETGLVITASRLLVLEWQAATSPGQEAHWSLLFEGHDVDSTQPLLPNDKEILEAQWMPLTEAMTVLTPAIVRRLNAWRSGLQLTTIYLEQTP
jgi:8-oxo-dGTP pyrophosphatase MutT (NUDIX family)